MFMNSTVSPASSRPRRSKFCLPRICHSSLHYGAKMVSIGKTIFGTKLIDKNMEHCDAKFLTLFRNRFRIFSTITILLSASFLRKICATPELSSSTCFPHDHVFAARRAQNNVWVIFQRPFRLLVRVFARPGNEVAAFVFSASLFWMAFVLSDLATMFANSVHVQVTDNVVPHVPTIMKNTDILLLILDFPLSCVAENKI